MLLLFFKVKEDWTLSPECFAFELYYQVFLSHDHSFATDFVEVVLQTAPTLLRSWSTGKCSIRIIFLSSSEIGSWPHQFPRENFRAKDVWVFVAEESDRCSEGSPISSPFGSDKQL